MLERPANPQPGNTLRALRLRRALSQERLAELTGVSTKSVQRAESGQVPASRIRARLARELRVSPQQIWADVQGDPTEPGPLLRVMREAQTDLTVEEAAAKIGISAEHLRRIERGEIKRRPNYSTLLALDRLPDGIDVRTLWNLWNFTGPDEAVAEIREASTWEMPLHSSSGELALELVLGTAGCPLDAPLLTSAHAGWGVLDLEIRDAAWDDQREIVREVCDALAASSDGLLIAYLELPGAPRPLALAQPDTSPFYKLEHPAGAHGHERIWRDYYHDAAYTLLDLADRRAQMRDVQLGHLTAHGWPLDLVTATLEGIGHLVDAREEPLYLRTLHIDPCCLPDPQLLDDATSRLNAEQLGPEPPEPRSVEIEPVDPVRPSLSGIDGLEIFKVNLV